MTSLGHIRVTLGHGPDMFGPTLVNERKHRPNLVNVGPTLDRVWPSLVKSLPEFAVFRPMLIGVGQHRARLVQISVALVDAAKF